MKSKPLPSQDTLRHLFDYDPITGYLIWKNTYSNKNKIGTTAGIKDNRGYIRISIDGVYYQSHRLIWMYVYGKDPIDLVIDHINGNRSDNRIKNLRIVTNQKNLFNQTKAKGCHWNKGAQKFEAQIMVNRKTTYLGLFETEQEAHQAYLNAKENLHIIETRGTEILQTTS